MKTRREVTRRMAVRPRVRSVVTLDCAEVDDVLGEEMPHPEGGARLTAGDVDADWQRADSAGDEAAGGSTATPDQDVVDEIARALGVEQPSDAEVHTSDEILRFRDRHYWHLERRAAETDEA